jgi:mannose-6-phosphate isomerase-like protein (cupin superfamily)
MTTSIDTGVRETAVYNLAPGIVARGQNFFVQWLQGDGTAFEAHSAHEMLLLLPENGAEVSVGQRAAQSVPGRSVCVLPVGDIAVQPKDGGRAVLIASSRADLAPGAACNEHDYASPDARIGGSDAGYRRTRGNGDLQVIGIDSIRPPADKPRLKMLQSDTLSINWVEYQDARDRSKLSPHSHADFEQGSLAIDGRFVHHLRVQWGADANQWRDDQHLEAGPASMITIPVHLIHTTEGVGAGRHLLIDVFSPPRKDFIDKGWVANSADYTRG